MAASTVSNSPITCPTCHATLTCPVFCSTCRVPNESALNLDYFQLLNLRPTFTIDEASLNNAFRAATRLIHPDRFANADDAAKSTAIRLSALLNEAARTLKDPLLRAEYLLKLAYGPDAITVRDVPKNLLVDVMMMREQLEEARASGDHQTLNDLRESIQLRRQKTLDLLAQSADSLAHTSDEAKREFRIQLNAMKYYDNLLDDLAVDPLAPKTGAAHAR